MDFNQRHLSPALGAQWTFAFCKLLYLKDWSGRMDLNHRPPGPEEGGRKHLSAASGVAYRTARPFTLLLKWTEVGRKRFATEWVATLVSLVWEIAGTSRRPNRIVELLHCPSAHLAFVNVRASNPWGDRHSRCES